MSVVSRSQRRLRDGWTTKESVLDRFLTLDNTITYSRSVPLLVRCILVKALVLGFIGSISYLIGAVIRKDDFYPNVVCIFTGGLISGCMGGFLLYCLPSFTSSKSASIIAQAMFLQAFVLSILAFSAAPAMGSFLLHAENSWPAMLIDQLVGVGFVLLVLFALLFIYRSWKQSTSNVLTDTSSLALVLSDSSSSSHSNSDTTSIEGLEMNPLNAIGTNSMVVHSNNTNATERKKKKPGTRALPFLSRIRSKHSPTET